MFGFGLKTDVRGSSKFGSNVRRTLRTFGDHKSPHFLPNLTGFLETIFNENEPNSEKVQFKENLVFD